MSDFPSDPEPRDYRPGCHFVAILATALTWPLLMVGGSVTVYRVGMAVPDWPLSFKSVNPEGWTSNMGGQNPGVRDEHGHRLIGATVGLLVTILTVWLVTRDPRRWVKIMGVTAWVAVVVMINSYSTGVNRPRAACLRRRW